MTSNEFRKMALGFPGTVESAHMSHPDFRVEGRIFATLGWQQKGVIRFWSVSDGSLRQVYDAHTGIGVTSPVAWSPDATRFAYGTYEGTAVVARTPLAIQTRHVRTQEVRRPKHAVHTSMPAD